MTESSPMSWVPAHETPAPEGALEVTLLTHSGDRMIADAFLASGQWKCQPRGGHRWFNPDEYKMKVIAWRPRAGDEPYDGPLA